MRILRVENANGEGPFAFNGYSIGIFNAKNFNSPEYPTTWEDKCSNCDYVCGCHTFDLLLHWFTGVWHCLNNFYVVEYEVENDFVLVGKKQCTFNRNKAIVISKLSVNELIS